MDNGPRMLVTALVLLACFGGPSLARKLRDDQIPSEDRFNFFDLELIQSIAQSQEGNVVVSPVSVKATLAMLLEAAGGESAAQLRTALRLPEHPTGVQAVINNYLTQLMIKGSGYKLELANKVFVSQLLSTNRNFAHTLQNKYYASLDSVDFTKQEKTARAINQWVKDTTRGLIQQLVEPGNLQPDTQVLLANAVYFKGKWKIPFDSTGTVSRCFYPVPEECRQANMMESLAYYNYSYLSALDAYALELPYEGDKFSMVVLMPKSVDGIAQLLRDIAHERMHNIIRSLAPTEVLVSLPRFDIEFSSDLVPTLSGLGVTDIFSPKSNLTGLFNSVETTAQVSNVFHKAKIIVNEEGSEAGAGTGALVIPLMGGSVIPKFRVDRPFLFFIRDMITGVIVFAGRVTEPEIGKPNIYQQNIDSVFTQAPTYITKTTKRRISNRRTTERPTSTTEDRVIHSSNNNEPKPVQPLYSSNQNQNNAPQQKPLYSQIANSQNPSYSQSAKPQSYSPQAPSSNNPIPNYENQYPTLLSTTNNQQPNSQNSQEIQDPALLYPKAPQNKPTYVQQSPQSTPHVIALSLNDHYQPTLHTPTRPPVYLSNQNSNPQYSINYNHRGEPSYTNSQNGVRDQQYTQKPQNTVREPIYTNTQDNSRDQLYTNPRITESRDPQYTNTQHQHREPSYANTRITDRDAQRREPTSQYYPSTDRRSSAENTQNNRNYMETQQISTTTLPPYIHYTTPAQTIPTYQYHQTNNDQYIKQNSFQANGQSGSSYTPANDSPHDYTITKAIYQEPVRVNNDAINFANRNQDGNH